VLPDFVVEPDEDAAEPPRPVVEPDDTTRPKLTAEEILNPEPPPGPLPDFIVAPEAHADEPPKTSKFMPKLRFTRPSAPSPLAGSAPDPVSDEPPLLANLGLPPLTEFPSLPQRETPAEPEEDAEGEEPQTQDPKRRRGRGDAPAQSKRGRRERSAGEPGDMSESVDWAGLSSRLSAYSLSTDKPAEEPSSDDDERADGEDSTES
jgi:hypothetical protein